MAAFWYAIDQVAKHLVSTRMSEGQTITLIDHVLYLTYVRNAGAAFSMASGATWVFSVLAAAVAVAIVVVARRISSARWALVFGLLLAGVLGNLTDRLFREPSFGLGHVVDFISTPWMMPAIYNVADVGIVVAMVLFIVLTIMGIGLNGERSAPRGAEDAEELGAPDEEPDDGPSARDEDGTHSEGV